MSTDFEEALIAFGQSLYAKWGTPAERERLRMRLRMRLAELIDVEFAETAFGTALKGIIARCVCEDDQRAPKKESGR